MANITFQTAQAALPAPSPHLSVRASGATLAAFAVISFLLCMLLGLAAPDWGLHRPWLQFYLGLTGFDLRSLALGIVQSIAFGSYAGTAIALLFNFFNRRFG
ncbi:hypothetical protein [Bosea sp. CS1GBMeth4]|uniref:hypothetical protein n=1 Tax=Bosea sp. CS1GBMeth4 TaxID=1892849 RepID=UPI0016485E57|nr:hypothetical protein [Bosea sp. CS1GBMeth4]